MTKLRIILNSKYLYILLTILLIISFLVKNNKSTYSLNDKEFKCIVLNIKINNKYRYELQCKEIIIGYSKNYYEIGDVLKIKGDLSSFSNNTNFNLYNYKKYYNSQGIFYKLKMNEVKVLGKSNRIDLLLKKSINKKIENRKSYPYLKSLLLGEKYYLDKDIEDIYKNIGIIHIFSVSGMHIMLLVLILEKIFKNKSSQIIIFILLFIYYKIIGSVSILRSLVLLILNTINIKYYLNLTKKKIIFLLISIMLLINIGYIYNIGFYYSVITCSSLILFRVKKYKYIYIPILCFIVTIPLNIYMSSQINIMSIISNILLLPIFTLIVFPFSILVFLFEFLDIYMVILIKVFEGLATFIDKFSINLIFIKPSIFIVICYYIFIFLSFKYKKSYILLFLMLIIHYNFNYIFPKTYFLMLDIGNGDSFLISHNNYNILVDTGGNNYDIASNITIPVLKSYGVKKLDLVILSHGDMDHAKEFIKIAEKIKVKEVYINNNEINKLEKNILMYLNDKKISYKKIDSLIIKRNNFILHSKSYNNKNENDSSILSYLIINNKKILFMGDASSYIEEQFISELNIKNIDILKVSHHGSKTSTSKKFISEIKPKYSLISAGRNNRYGHPNKEVLKNLKNSKIYRTDLDGSIMFKIKSKKLKIKTCSP